MITHVKEILDLDLLLLSEGKMDWSSSPVCLIICMEAQFPQTAQSCANSVTKWDCTTSGSKNNSLCDLIRNCYESTDKLYLGGRQAEFPRNTLSSVSVEPEVEKHHVWGTGQGFLRWENSISREICRVFCWRMEVFWGWRCFGDGGIFGDRGGFRAWRCFWG